ncbi:MAG: SPASM domain-containing protein [Leptospiraceae bacterium]|nr:SPASM domain-containing protein [Leptospiraceae bacterium]
MNTTYHIPKELGILKNSEESILFNSKNVNPVYFVQGGDEVYKFLKNSQKSGGVVEINEDYENKEFFEFLCFHSLLLREKEEVFLNEKNCSSCQVGEHLSSSRSVYLLLTQSCNQACVYCLNGVETYQKANKLMMNQGIAYRAVKETFESITENGNLEVVFFGGEPLMNWNLAKQIIDYCENVLKKQSPTKSIHYHLTSNLTLMPKDLIEFAKRYHITFLIDVDGPELIHNISRPFLTGKGSFYATAKNIERLLKAGLEVALRATITTHNHDKMLEVTKTHKELGGNSSAFVPLNPVDSDIQIISQRLWPNSKNVSHGLKEVYHSGIWDKKNIFPFNEYSSRLVPGHKNQYSCGAPHGNTPVITVDGKIYSCIYLVGNEKYEIGDLAKNDFPRQNKIQMMKEIVDIENREKCKECTLRNLCGGGCPVGIFSIADNPKASQEVKNYVQEMSCTLSYTVLNELLWDIAKRKKDEYYKINIGDNS